MATCDLAWARERTRIPSKSLVRVVGAPRAQRSGMSDGLNLVTLFGNLGADPEVRVTDKGVVMKLRLATSRSWLDKEEKKHEETEWHTLKMFGRRAEGAAKYLHKGSKVAVRGRLSTSQWEKEGQKRSKTEVIIDELCFGSGRPNGALVSAPAFPAVGAEDLPF